jgi:hypothetical protein
VRRHPSHNERPGALANSVSKGEDDVHRSKEASQRCVSVKAMRPMLSHGACEADGGYALSPWPPSPRSSSRGKACRGAGDSGSVMLSAIGTDIRRFDAVARTPLRQG